MDFHKKSNTSISAPHFKQFICIIKIKYIPINKYIEKIYSNLILYYYKAEKYYYDFVLKKIKKKKSQKNKKKFLKNQHSETTLINTQNTCFLHFQKSMPSKLLKSYPMPRKPHKLSP